MATPLYEMNPVFLLAYIGTVIGTVVFCYLAWRAGKNRAHR